MSDSKAGTKTESRAVALARAHLEAWTNHDLDTVRGNLAEDVPGSLRVIATMGDERNALIMYEVSTEGGPIGSKVFPSAQTWLLDENGKIKVERIVSYAAPR